MPLFLKTIFPRRFWLVVMMYSMLHSQVLADDAPATLLYTEHPLVNRIWAVQQQRFVEREQLLEALDKARYVLLGETHDNLAHHVQQAQIIDYLSRQQRSVSVAFEMIDPEQAELIERKRPDNSADLIKLLNKVTKGWQYELYYKVVFDSVYRAGFEMIPANLTRQTMRSLMRQEQDAMPAEIGALIRDTPFSEQQTRSLQEEIIRGHCNHIDETVAAKMVTAQRARDAALAVGLLQGGGEVRVLITGAGHARTDRGVPLYLRTRDKAGQLVSVGFVEVSENKEQVDDYFSRWGDKSLPFDYVWFTPYADREDPCESFLKSRR